MNYHNEVYKSACDLCNNHTTSKYSVVAQLLNDTENHPVSLPTSALLQHVHLVSTMRITVIEGCDLDYR